MKEEMINYENMEFFSMNLQEDATMSEIIEILNAVRFALSSEILEELSEDTKRHFKKIEQ